MKGERLVVGIDGREIPVVIDAGGHVEVEGASFTARETWPGTWHVTAEGRTTVVHVARDAGGCWVHAGGRVHRLDVGPAGAAARRRADAGPDHGLMAPMPATVRAVLAEPGQAVTAGDTILMLEAMKMELPIRAPRDGVVTAIHCREGQLVQPGVPLVELS
jgi:3-methylcrotonyl-CoA carboxylase alpha subunit